MDGDSDEDYLHYGKALGVEEASQAGSYRKPIQDPALVRSLPVWQQEPTDSQGRKRFHGAFTGGFSAGYYNTVGSEVGTAVVCRTNGMNSLPPITLVVAVSCTAC